MAKRYETKDEIEHAFRRMVEVMAAVAIRNLVNEKELKDIYKQDVLDEMSKVWDDMYEWAENLPEPEERKEDE
jgi:hypothetical protein